MPDVKTGPRICPETKRARGGQKGNQNARKHGFYSKTLGIAETCEFWNITNLEGLDAEVAVLRIKLKSLLQRDPCNRRVLGEASKILTKWLSARYRLDHTGTSQLKQFVRILLVHSLSSNHSKTIGFHKTNQASFNN